jgi:hypothetical protein
LSSTSTTRTNSAGDCRPWQDIDQPGDPDRIGHAGQIHAVAGAEIQPQCPADRLFDGPPQIVMVCTDSRHECRVVGNWIMDTRARDHLLVTGITPVSEFVDDFLKGS